jgi:hypothetical protein
MMMMMMMMMIVTRRTNKQTNTRKEGRKEGRKKIVVVGVCGVVFVFSFLSQNKVLFRVYFLENPKPILTPDSGGEKEKREREREEMRRGERTHEYATDLYYDATRKFFTPV